MDAARRRALASKGGRTAHARGTAHEWSSREASLAGKKSGLIRARNGGHQIETASERQRGSLPAQPAAATAEPRALGRPVRP